MIYDVKNFGAVGDGKTLCTAALQQAIDSCAAAGGGRVLISDGRYMSGTIKLRSGVDLHIASNGVLLGSPDCKDYPEPENMLHTTRELLPRERGACFIYAEEAENISITGMGRIDCNGTAFVKKKDEADWRCWGYERIDAPTPPRVVFFTGCKNVRVKDITMTNQPAGWSYWIHDCDYVTFDRCKIIAEVNYPNNDGIHINCSRNVNVSNCDITCGDDCIIVRANCSSLKENKVCEKVTVMNCNLTSWSSGIRIGWINDGTIRNCTFSNLVMTDTSVGISLLLPGRGKERIPDEGREETLVENITFSNIIMDGINSNPLLIHIAECEHTHVKAIRNLYFSGVRARAAAHPMIFGRKDAIIENLQFSDCTFERSGPFNRCHGARGIINYYPDYHNGSIVLQYVKNVVMNNTSFSNETALESVDIRSV